MSLTYATSHMPNVKYGGFGYDALKGNPHNTIVEHGIDPGYTPSLIWNYQNYSLNQMSPDGRFIVPNGVDVLSATQCDCSFSFKSSTSSSSYQSQLDVGASMSADVQIDIFNARFSASTDFQKVHNDYSKGSQLTSTSSMICSTYQIDNSQYLPKYLTFSNEFIETIKQLPTSFDKNQYKVCGDNDNPFATFIANFGTHYPAKTVMGCKMGQRSTQTYNSYQSFSSSNLNIAVSAQFSCIFVKGSRSINTTIEKTEASAYSNTTETQNEYFTGNATYQQDCNAYLSQCTFDPFPIGVELLLIIDLINPINFPTIKNIDQKVNALTAAFKTYCQCMWEIGSLVSNCSEFSPGPSVPDRSIFGGTYTVTHPNETFSIKNVYTNPNQLGCNDGFKSFLIFSSCYPGFGGDCMENYLCLNQTIMDLPYDKRIDPMNYFGGIYSDLNNNPITGNKGCPNGYTSVIIALDSSSCDDSTPCGQENNKVNIYSCYNDKVDLGYSFIGGFYAYNVLNEYTRANNCPPGYTDYPALSYMHTLNQHGITYMCLNNIYT